MRYIAVKYTDRDAYVINIPTLASESPMPLYDIVIQALNDKINAAQDIGTQAAQTTRAMETIVDLSRKFIDSHTDTPNWVIHEFVAWCQQQHQ